MDLQELQDPRYVLIQETGRAGKKNRFDALFQSLIPGRFQFICTNFPPPQFCLHIPAHYTIQHLLRISKRQKYALTSAKQELIVLAPVILRTLINKLCNFYAFHGAFRSMVCEHVSDTLAGMDRYG